MATVTSYPGVNVETGRIDFRITSQTIAKDYSPTKLATSSGKEFDINLPSLPNAKNLAETDTAINTAVFWFVISGALLSFGIICKGLANATINKPSLNRALVIISGLSLGVGLITMLDSATIIFFSSLKISK